MPGLQIQFKSTRMRECGLRFILWNDRPDGLLSSRRKAGTGMIGIIILLYAIELVLMRIGSELSDISHWLWAISMHMSEHKPGKVEQDG